MDQDNELLEISGTVDSVIYKNEENGYTVLRLKDGSDESVTVVGCFPYAAAGETMIASGSWMTHNVHGRQFKAEFAQRLMPSSASAIYEYLAGGSVRGVGPATAALLVDRFGEKTLDVLESSPEQLSTVKGISGAKAEQSADLDEVDLRGARLDRVDGVESLGGATLSAEQVLDLAPALARAAGITIGPWPESGENYSPSPSAS